MAGSIVKTLLLTTIVACTNAGGFPKDVEQKNFECVPYHQVLRDVLVEASATHFATVKLPFSNHINPNDIEPLTIESLFQNYYGENVCAQRFESAYQEILYSDPGTEKPKSDKDSSSVENDKLKLRAFVRQLATAEDFGSARIKFGALIVRSLTDLLDKSWIESRCVARYELSNAESVIWNEIYKLMASVSWRQFTEMFGLSVGSRLSIAIDETGTMSREIAAASERSQIIMDEERGSVYQPNYFVLVPFNDPAVGPVTATHSADNYTNSFNLVIAHGGGDPPEMTMRGISLALEKMQPASQLFVYTDAESKDALLQDYVIALAKLKQIRISFVITSRIWSILCFGASRAENAQACSDRTLKFGNDLYEHIARETGGRLLLVPRTDLKEGSKIMNTITKDTFPLIAETIVQSGDVSMAINVDSSVSKLLIESSSGCQNLAVEFDSDEIPFESQSSINQALDSVVNVDEFGSYTITAYTQATQQCTLRVKGVSTKGLVTTFAHDVENENGDVVLRKVEGTPLGDAAVTVLMDAFGFEEDDKVTDVDVIDVYTGESLQTISLSEPSSGRYRFQVKQQSGKTLRLQARGQDFDSFQLQRIVSPSFTFTTFDFDCSEMDQKFARPGEITRYEVGVKNFGARTASLRLSVNDNQEYIKSFGQTKLVVPRAQTKNIVVALEVPEDAKPGTVVTIILTGQAITPGSTMFYKKYQVTIREPISFECQSYKVVSDVSLRFATTTITHTLSNRDSVIRNYKFRTALPSNAYVTAFKATVDGVVHNGDIVAIEEIEELPQSDDVTNVEPKQEREFSISSEVESTKPSSKFFQTSVPVKAGSSVTFVLTYQEVIVKQTGKYRHQIVMNPGIVTNDFSVIINICEVGEITKIVQNGILTELDARANILSLPGLTASSGGNTAVVKYEPSTAQQTDLSPSGVKGSIVVEYTIKTSDPNGNAIGSTNSFIQFLHPQLQVMQRRVVFVIDASAYMFGDKMAAMRKAMEMMISRFNPTDMFTIVAINSDVNNWNNQLNPASSANTVSANLFLQNLQARGDLNLAQGIKEAVKILNYYAKIERTSLNPAVDYLFVITGGKSSGNIVKEVGNAKNIGINTCGLSDVVNADALYKFSQNNNGQSLLISNTANAAELILEFSETLENSALVGGEVLYENAEISSTSNRMFNKYLLGTELMISGSTNTALSSLNYVVSGLGDGGDISESGSMPVAPADELCSEIEKEDDSIERMSVFIELIQLLKYREIAKAKTIAVDYGFVVPGLTKIQLETAQDAEIFDEPFLEEPTARSANLTVNDTEDFTETTETPPTTVEVNTVSFATPGLVLPPKTKAPNKTVDKMAEAKMEVYGDPHFVVDIGPQIRLCFNWDSQSGEIFKLLDDPVSGISVNARLASIRAPEESLRNKRTYVSRLGFVFNLQNTTVLINPYVARINFGKKGSEVVRFSDSKVLRGRGMRFVMQYINSYSSSFTIYVGKDVTFKVISRVKSSSSYIRDHLDYSVVNKKGISRQARGIMGELNSVTYKKSPATLDIQPDGQTAMLWYRNKVVPVSHHTIVDYNAKTEVECWYLANKSLLWPNEDKKFAIDNILKSEESARSKPK